MKIIKILKQSFIALLRNKGRSFLTILGIIIGIGSVIALISLGNGVQKSISGQIKSLGTTNMSILPGEGFAARVSTKPGQRPPESGPGGGQGLGQGVKSSLTFADVTSIRTLNKVSKVSGNISSSEIFSDGTVEKRYNVVGIDQEYFPMQNLVVSKGKLFSSQDVTAKSKSAVVGSTFADDVFHTQDVVNKTLTIEKDTYTIVGVLATHNESGFANFNLEVFVPNRTLAVTTNQTNLSSIAVQADNENDVDTVKNEIQTTLLKNHNINDAKLADFSIITAKDLLSTITQVTSLLTSFLAGIAAMSLLVGGIGIMNIMLVSVTERTREIGLRKAVGAKTSDILIQFIIESVMLTVIGGLIGIGLGVLVAGVVGHFITVTPDVTLGAIGLAVGVSTFVGLVFGIYPAALAARLNPIDALRYE